MRTLPGLTLALTLALPATAEELRPAPDYYVEALFSVSMAEALVKACSSVTLNLTATGTRTSEVSARLVEDGFDPALPFAEMIDPAPAIRALQAAFLDRYPVLDAPSEAEVCGVAESEIAADTAIGQLLMFRTPAPETAPDTD